MWSHIRITAISTVKNSLCGDQFEYSGAVQYVFFTAADLVLGPMGSNTATLATLLGQGIFSSFLYPTLLGRLTDERKQTVHKLDHESVAK